MKLEHSFTVPADLDTVWQALLDPERVAPCMPGATLTEVDGDTFKGSVKVKMGPISLLYKGSGEFLSKDEPARTVVIKAAGKDARGNGTASATVTVSLEADGAATIGKVVTDLSITGKPAQFGRGLISEVGGKILDSFATCLASKLAPSTTPAEAEETPKLSVVEKERPQAPAAAESAPTAQLPEAEGGNPAAAPAPSPASVAQAQAEAEAVATGREAGETASEHAPRAARPRLSAVPEPENEPIDLLAFAGPSVLKRVAPLVAVVVAVLIVLGLRRRR
ncbi:SRPBCC family protein [Actinophytocola algeriensis]|uniref:Carbon monoxide dehydrogenase subunit G n=1 Tax=Actinophytocola algeriensis TaxID=1768010 RepID=A0A7W7Q611_9PSEU|nr:SRPBCC family protein [Actinophytocola algeriensis]MBB4907369.1 carbon monoxide dehydrogenase subunit G [Actinophytocola algeriensis]MBE1478852.1 carbon monoxide dehydrogenase subunit G [Actinophytocola algeriensis]